MRETIGKAFDRVSIRVGGVALVLALAATAASAQEYRKMEPQFPQQQTAGELLRACASSRLTGTGRERRRYCDGFVSGVEEAERVLHPGGESQRTFCTPARVTASDLAAAFVRYGAEHENELSEPAARVVLRSLEQAWPCRGASK